MKGKGKSMSDVRSKLMEAGLKLEGLTDEQVKALAKVLNLEVPRQVQIVEYTSKRGRTANYVKTDAFVISKNAEGKAETAQGLFLRVEAIDQAIADLQKAKDLLK
jgi:uncharacterized Ntn-hydrolase superfamily protein